jgi:hypothetical protein
MEASRTLEAVEQRNVYKVVEKYRSFLLRRKAPGAYIVADNDARFLL